MKSVKPLTPLLPLLLAALLRGGPVGAAPTAHTPDPDGALGRAGAPTCVRMRLDRGLARAAAAHRLVVREGSRTVPAQFEPDEPGGVVGSVWWLMPPGGRGTRAFTVEEAPRRPATLMRAVLGLDGHVLLSEGTRPVLRYVARTVEPGSVLEQATEANRIYARARSGYIHPLYTPQGAEITHDWSLDHPHHRGIYWAWPEVDWRAERGDLHALQRVFSRPAGAPRLVSGPVFAQVTAPNVWRWDDRTGIVNEVAVIRAFRSGRAGRCVDLRLEMRAVADEVLLARRGATQYGGLNMRLARVGGQQIAWHTDLPGARPRMAWQSHSGRFGPAGEHVTLSTFQHAANPDYPGDWVKFPELNWSQPTFPRSGARHVLRPSDPLTLRYRLWVRPGGLPPEDAAADVWRAYHALPASAMAPPAAPRAMKEKSRG